MASRRNEGTLMEFLRLLPWWACLLVGAAGMVGIGWGINQVMPAIGSLAWLLGGLFALLCVLVAGQSAAASAHRRRLLARGTTLDQLLALDPYDFERWVGAWYRARGFSVHEQGLGGADGGVDLFLRKQGKLTLVQCKRYRTRAVGAPVVRELAGLLGHHSASAAILVTTSRFTVEAQMFARGKPIELIDGPRLQQMLGQTPARADGPGPAAAPVPAVASGSSQPTTVQQSTSGLQTVPVGQATPSVMWPDDGTAVAAPASPSAGTTAVAPTVIDPTLQTAAMANPAEVTPVTTCVRCGQGQMVQRRNRRSGEAFLGCSRYPQCRNTAPVPEPVAG